MIKETIEKNEEVKVNTKEIEILRKHFPACFDKDGKFDIKAFEELIKKEDVDIKKEGYSLNFLGKSYARYLSSLDSETVIVPDKENKNIESENIYIVGDNLDALQHLKYSYSEKIKCIYIDPPYNTGNDGFVYNDKFEFTAEELAKKINIEEDEAERILNMQGKSTHSAWLTFMYPRLELARELLSDDGVIFISIDDNEQANLKLVCDLVFGEGNFITSCTRIAKRTSNKGTYFKPTKDYVLVYTKNQVKIDWKFGVLKEQDIDDYKYEDEKGKYKKNGASLYQPSLDSRPNQRYWIECPDGSLIIPPGNVFPEKLEDAAFVKPVSNQDKVWRWSYPTYLEKKDKLIFTPASSTCPLIDSDGNPSKWNIYDKVYLDDKEGETLLPEDVIYDYVNSQGTKELLDLEIPFSYAKPSNLIKYLIDLCKYSEDITVMDFFSGSATTAHAVMQLNAEDGGNRKYIMVQLDEQVKEGSEAEQAGYKTIDEIGRERIRRAAVKIKEEEPEKSKNIDLGFKTYYLKEADKNTLDKIRDFNPDMPFDAGDIKDKFGIETIIETWKIKDGFGFNAKVEKIDLEGYTAYKVSNSEIGEYLYLLDEMEDAAIKELVRKIEAFELNIDKIIEYGYSFSYNANTALRANLKTLKNKNAIDVIIRY